MALISGSVVPEALSQHCRQIAMRARQASIDLASMPTEKKVAALKGAAAQIRADVVGILAANRLDVAAAAGFGLSPAEIDRLVLDPKRVEGIAAGVEAVANLPDPVGEVLERSTRPNGLEICKLRVPLGVVFFIYESRPNVTADAAAVAIASGNAIILRGGKEAAHSSARLVVSVRQAIAAAGLPDDCVQLVDTPNRDAVGALLSMDDLIDIVIPRGGETSIAQPIWPWQRPLPSMQSASGWGSATQLNPFSCTAMWQRTFFRKSLGLLVNIVLQSSAIQPPSISFQAPVQPPLPTLPESFLGRRSLSPSLTHSMPPSITLISTVLGTPIRSLQPTKMPPIVLQHESIQPW